VPQTIAGLSRQSATGGSQQLSRPRGSYSLRRPRSASPTRRLPRRAFRSRCARRKRHGGVVRAQPPPAIVEIDITAWTLLQGSTRRSPTRIAFGMARSKRISTNQLLTVRHPWSGRAAWSSAATLARRPCLLTWAPSGLDPSMSRWDRFINGPGERPTRLGSSRTTSPEEGPGDPSRSECDGRGHRLRQRDEHSETGILNCARRNTSPEESSSSGLDGRACQMFLDW